MEEEEKSCQQSGRALMGAAPTDTDIRLALNTTKTVALIG